MGRGSRVRGKQQSQPTKSKTDKTTTKNNASTKLSIYLPKHIVEEIRSEAERQDRSFSWMLREGWRLSRDRICARQV